MPTTKIFRGHVNGYTFVTADLAEMQAWINVRKQDCKGHTLSLHQGCGTVRCASYHSNSPSRTAVL